MHLSRVATGQLRSVILHAALSSVGLDVFAEEGNERLRECITEYKFRADDDDLPTKDPFA